jgi:uncharacterized protein YlxW (UPF0749 family)
MARSLVAYHQKRAECWKAKAVERAKEIKLNRQLLRELREGRAKLKEEIAHYRSRLKLCEEQLKNQDKKN